MNVLGTAVTAAWLLKVFSQGWQVCVIYLQAKKLHMNHKQIPEYLRTDNLFSSVGPSVKSDQRDFLCSLHAPKMSHGSLFRPRT